MKVGKNGVTEEVIEQMIAEVLSLCSNLKVKEISTIVDETSYNYGDSFVLLEETGKSDCDLTYWLTSLLDKKGIMDTVCIYQDIQDYAVTCAVGKATEVYSSMK